MLRTRIAQAAAVTALVALTALGVDAAAGQADGTGRLVAAAQAGASTDSMGWS
ncbi:MULTISPECIES: hypothetical protein [unclassified Streptomyces]|uniref:hypothetical protein n=1 Tax=unclassified Streptomyces TaxID=2593676 RepID=UPI000A5F6584|nr:MULTISPECIES: hypothetical protein [unclassified Streptomyces]